MGKKAIKVTNAFQKVLNELKRLLNKIWLGEGSEFYNGSVKSWLQDRNVLNTVKENLLLLKNVIELWRIECIYIDKLDDIVNKCKNVYHRPITMKPIDV